MHDTDTSDLSEELPDDGGTEAPEVSIYKQYVDSLRAQPPLTESQRKRLHEQGARNLLWLDACKLVLYAFRQELMQGRIPGVVRLDDMDMIQEANVAAGRALALWDPAKGKLSTWLWPHIRFALLRHALEEQQHAGQTRASLDDSVGSEELAEAQDVPGMEQAEEIRLEDQLIYDHHVFDEPEAAAMHAEFIKRLCEGLPAGVGDLAADFLFKDMKVTELAEKYAVSVPTVYNRLRKIRMLDI